MSPEATPSASAPTPAPVPVPGRDGLEDFNVLSDAQLGYLVASPGGTLGGRASGPEGLIADNALLIGNTGAALIGNTGAALIGNTGAALIGNTGAALIGNTGAALIGNTGGAYRVSATVRGVASGFVYLTTQDERLFVNARRRLLSALTDDDGSFGVPAPATDSLVVNVLLGGNRRLSCLTSTIGASGSIEVDLGSTLATEFLRAKAAQFGFGFADVRRREGAASSFGRILEMTRALLADERALALFRPEDLVINNLPRLRQRYVVAFGTTRDRSLSDEWTRLLKILAGAPPDAPDYPYRPLALTTVETGAPPGHSATAIAAAPDGAIYVADRGAQSAAIRRVNPDGTNEILIEKARTPADGMEYVLGLAVTPSGKLVMADAMRAWIALFDPDPAARQGNAPNMDYTDYSGWSNPRLLFDAWNQVLTNASVHDLTLDDEADPGLYFADSERHSVLFVPRILSSGTGTFLRQTLVGFHNTRTEAGDPVPGANWDVSRLNSPGAVAFHRRGDGTRLLYIADTGNQVLLEVNLGSGKIRRVAGKVPPYAGPAIRQPACYGPEEDGGSALAANLRDPHKMIVDARGRLVFADTGNNLIRLVTIADPVPRIWTLAGMALPDDDACNQDVFPPLAARLDGEARQSAIGEPYSLALDRDGNLLFTDARSNRVRKLWTSFLQ